MLVVSIDRFNARSEYVTVVPGSTRLRPLITHVKLEKGEGGLARPTMLLCERLQELHLSVPTPAPIGSLSEERMLAVKQAILFYLGMA